MPPPTAHIIELAHGAMSTHILGALPRLDIAEHLAAGPRGVAAGLRADAVRPAALTLAGSGVGQQGSRPNLCLAAST